MKKIKDLYYKIIQWISNQPKMFVRIVVLTACFVAVVFQLTECVIKLLRPPITTHSHFDLNATMYYPAVTFCRNPAYKLDVLENLNLSVHPIYLKSWENFDFGVSDLPTVFSTATYSKDEFFVESGVTLKLKPEHVQIEETLNFNVGKCYTVKPLITTRDALRESGYSIELNHSNSNLIHGESPGWHVYIHEPHEKFSEEGMKKSGRVEYMFIDVDEEITLKVVAQHFVQLQGYNNKCTDDPDLGTSICGEYCKWNMVTKKVGCTGPWMPINVPMCKTVNDTINLIDTYKKTNVEERDCGCHEPCRSVIYSTFVVNRKKYDQGEPKSLVYLHYSSKMVTYIEERFGYNFSQFIADIGGSMGFLLGLSVIGLIAILEKLLECVLRRGACLKENPDDEGTLENSNNNSKDKNEKYVATIDDNLKY